MNEKQTTMKLRSGSCGARVSNSHFGEDAEFGVHPLGCPTPENTLKRGHQTAVTFQSEDCRFRFTYLNLTFYSLC